MADPANQQARVQTADPMGNYDQMAGLSAPPSNNLPANAGNTNLATAGMIYTAQKVAVPRDYARIKQQLSVLCAISGRDYIYSWEVNDNQNRRKQTIEGPTVKLANDLARTYGNCLLGIQEVVDAEDAWLFKAVFTDLETGYTYMRPFRQAKEKNVGKGMRDRSRQDDLIFQIGASKALRNVVVNALSTFKDFMMEESRKNLVGWVEQNEEKAQKFIDEVCDQHTINIKRIEAVVGRTRNKWTVNDKVRVLMELRGIKDGLSTPDELYPTSENAEEVMKAKQGEGKPAVTDKKDPPKQEEKGETKAEPKVQPKQETKPAEEQQQSDGAPLPGEPVAKKEPNKKGTAKAKPKPADDDDSDSLFPGDE